MPQRHKRCDHINCDKHPLFGVPGFNKKEFCKAHAPVGYEDVKNKRCAHINCDILNPVFGVPGSNKGEFCKAHAPVGYEDVKNKRCAHINCDKHPNFGVPGFSPEFCGEHRKDGMVAFPRKRKRTVDSTCQFCTADVKYDANFCSSCKRYVELGNVTVKKKRKEDEIHVLLNEHFGKENVRNDRRIANGCSLRRPDFELLASWGTIIVEVDEHQHNRKTYPCECEITRMKQIYFDCGVERLLFVRYNPDSFKTFEGDAVNPRTQCVSKARRQDLLVKYVKEELGREFRQDREVFTLGVIYLFYDGFSAQAMEIEKIDPYAK